MILKGIEGVNPPPAATAAAGRMPLHWKRCMLTGLAVGANAGSLQYVLGVMLGRELHAGRQLLLFEGGIKLLEVLLVLGLLAEGPGKFVILLLQAFLL